MNDQPLNRRYNLRSPRRNNSNDDNDIRGQPSKNTKLEPRNGESAGVSDLASKNYTCTMNLRRKRNSPVELTVGIGTSPNTTKSKSADVSDSASKKHICTMNLIKKKNSPVELTVGNIGTSPNTKKSKRVDVSDLASKKYICTMNLRKKRNSPVESTVGNIGTSPNTRKRKSADVSDSVSKKYTCTMNLRKKRNSPVELTVGKINTSPNTRKSKRADVSDLASKKYICTMNLRKKRNSPVESTVGNIGTSTNTRKRKSADVSDSASKKHTCTMNLRKKRNSPVELTVGNIGTSPNTRKRKSGDVSHSASKKHTCTTNLRKRRNSPVESTVGNIGTSPNTRKSKSADVSDLESNKYTCTMNLRRKRNSPVESTVGNIGTSPNTRKSKRADVCDSPTKTKLKPKENSLQVTPKKQLGTPKTPRKNETRVKYSNKGRGKNISKLKKKLLNEDNENEISEESQLNESFIEALIKYTKIKSLSPKQNGGKKIRKRNQRGSYEKYGVLFPTGEQILESISRMKSEADALDAYEKEYGLGDSIPPILKTDVNRLDPPEEQNLLDCKHLSSDKLQEYFQKNIDYITSILNGSLISERHERFKNYDPRNNLSMLDLTYSPSIVVFTDGQRDLLIKLLEEQFDPFNDNTEYLFKVLLPDLCSKIFMDVYKKSAKEAIDYLNWRPLD